MNRIDQETMHSVSGGNAVIFDNGQPVCPICGAVNRMEITAQSAGSTIYRCTLCGQISTYEVPVPDEPLTSCPVCGASGAAFRIIADHGSTKRYRCLICNHETEQ